MIRRIVDGVLLGAIIGTIGSSVYVGSWYLMDRTLDRLGPFELIGWSGLVLGVTFGVLAALSEE